MAKLHTTFTHMEELELKVVRLNKNARLPTRGSSKSAGYDLYSSVRGEIQPGKACAVTTGLSIEVPSGHYGRIAPRSSLALKLISVGAGVVDEDYRGEICVVLFNHSNIIFPIDMKTPIAQLILEKISTPPVKEVSELSKTERGTGGFGSTDKNKGVSTLDFVGVEKKAYHAAYSVVYETPKSGIFDEDDFKL